MKKHSAKPVKRRNLDLCDSNEELITLEECRKLVGTLPLSDERILAIRNGVIGIVNSVLNAYLERFEEHGC
jgi:hypothetical protein